MELPSGPLPGPALDALGNETRRRVVEMLLESPRSVGELAEGLPVSRPAVSKHLRVLEAAHLVAFVRRGTARIYAVRPDAVMALRDHWEQVWDVALRRYAAFVEREDGS